jgi:hypothetical protein
MTDVGAERPMLAVVEVEVAGEMTGFEGSLFNVLAADRTHCDMLAGSGGHSSGTGAPERRLDDTSERGREVFGASPPRPWSSERIAFGRRACSSWWTRRPRRTPIRYSF